MTTPAAPSTLAQDLRYPTSPSTPNAAAIGTLAGLAALLLYAATCARGVEWQDSGVHQFRILTGLLENHLGLALSHPLHYWLGRLALRIPVGDPFLKLNLLAGICGAVGVGVLAGIVVRLTRSRIAAGFAAATLALSHSYWQMSALTETYTLAAALMTIEWALLLGFIRTRRPAWLIAVFAINGLHVATHMLGTLTLATYGILLLERIWRRRVPFSVLPLAIGTWIVTASPYWSLVAAHYMNTGDLLGTLQSAFFGGGADNRSWAAEVLNVSMSAGQLKLVIMTFGYCLPSLAGVLVLVGLLRPMRGRRRIFRRVLLAQTVIICIFVARYSIKDLYTFFVPVCALAALWFGWGLAGWLRRWRGGKLPGWVPIALVLNALLPVVVYAVFPVVAEQRGWLRDRLRDLPYRNEYRAFFRPWRCDDHSADQLARDVLADVGVGGWILSGGTAASPIASTYLTYGGPDEVYVYWGSRCLTQPGVPPLQLAELREHIEQGGRALAVPSPYVDLLVRPPLRVDRTEPIWRIELGSPPHTP